MAKSGGRARLRRRRPTAFISYARTDGAIVYRFAEALKRLGVETWLDVDRLSPGESFETSIREAIGAADAFIFFASQAGLSSEWMEAELLAFVDQSDRTLIPIFLGDVDVSVLPRALSSRHGLFLRGMEDIDDVAASVADELLSGSSATGGLDRRAGEIADKFAHDLASEVSGRDRPVSLEVLRSAFVVHGHDRQMLTDVHDVLTGRGIDPIVLSRLDEDEVGDDQQSLFRKFNRVAGQAEFAVVLMSADDVGASRRQHDAVPDDRALRFRARQNVVFELGFFFGKLGWDRVLVLWSPPDVAWPDFERPSDLDGVVFSEYADDRKWESRLTAKLSAAGLVVGHDGSA